MWKLPQATRASIRSVLRQGVVEVGARGRLGLRSVIKFATRGGGVIQGFAVVLVKGVLKKIQL